jgi:hypothetical protein
MTALLRDFASARQIAKLLNDEPISSEPFMPKPTTQEPAILRRQLLLSFSFLPRTRLGGFSDAARGLFTPRLSKTVSPNRP